MSQTWIIKDTAPDISTLHLAPENGDDEYIIYSASFESNGEVFSSLKFRYKRLAKSHTLRLYYNDILVTKVLPYNIKGSYTGRQLEFQNEAYRTLKFDTAPTGDLLTWLQKNAYKQTEYLTLKSELTSVANAIRAKGGTSAPLVYPAGFVSAIQAIQTGVPLQIVVTTSAGATVTATNGSKTISGTADSTGVCTLTVPETGTWSVSATLGGQTSDTKTVSITGSYAVALTFSFVSSTLNNNDWSVIKSVSDAGQGENYWSIGDGKEVTLNGTVGHLTLSDYTTYAFIIGFNHNASVEGSNRIHFQLGKTELSGGKDVALCDSYYNKTGGGFRMNTSSSNSGGWASSNMRTAICGTSLSSYSGTIISVIPAALRAVLKSVTKYTDNTGNSSAASAVTATTDYFFLLSEYEAFGTINQGNTNESSKQAQYSYYSAGNSQIKYSNGTSAAKSVFWWFRSPTASNSTSFVFTLVNGAIGKSNADYSRGFAPGFCV